MRPRRWPAIGHRFLCAQAAVEAVFESGRLTIRSPQWNDRGTYSFQGADVRIVGKLGPGLWSKGQACAATTGASAAGVTSTAGEGGEGVKETTDGGVAAEGPRIVPMASLM